jgi:hypothetical protein
MQNTPSARGVGLGAHELLDQPAERLDPSLGLAAAEDARVMNIPGGQMGQRAAALVFELDQRRAARSGRDRRVAAGKRL